jgi:hypothetical protein
MTEAKSRRSLVWLVSGMLTLSAVACSSEPEESGPPSNGGRSGAGGSAAIGGSSGGGAGGASSGGSAGTNQAGGSGVGTGGNAGSGGNGATTGGNAGSAGNAGTGGTSGSGGTAGNAGTGGSGGTAPLARFSFFVTSLKAMRELSGSQNGFGGDLRFGETGEGAGLRGADKICTRIAEKSMPGSGAKQWRAYLSTTTGGENGGPVHAIDRVGQGPWYDRLGRIVANTRNDLIAERPVGADQAIIDDLPNEDGVPNHQPDPTQGQVDNHDFLTGSNDQGQLFNTNRGYTCNDWTSAVGSTGTPRCGHSWPRRGGPGGFGGAGPSGFGGAGGGFGNMAHWISALNEAGCAPGVNLIEMGPPNPANPTVGSGGGYGGFYCFALTP